jgi:hypothetical protein
MSQGLGQGPLRAPLLEKLLDLAFARHQKGNDLDYSTQKQMAESGNVSSNSEPGARLRDRPKGRPVGTARETNWLETKGVADREGFEPPIPLQVCRISSAVHSTTLPPVRGRSGRSGVLTTHCVGPAQAFPTQCREKAVAAQEFFASMLLFLDGSPSRDYEAASGVGKPAPDLFWPPPAVPLRCGGGSRLRRATRPRNRLPKSRPACAPRGT